MAKIVTTSQLQKTIGQLISSIGASWLVITNKGHPKVIMLPYFDDSETAIADYMEEYKKSQKKIILQKKKKESHPKSNVRYIV
jgi:hypothetical protein